MRQARSYRLNRRLELRMDQDRFRLRIIHHEFDFVFLQQRINRASQRSYFPACKVRDDVLCAIRHEQTHYVAFSDVACREQRCRAINRGGELSISKLATIALDRKSTRLNSSHVSE